MNSEPRPGRDCATSAGAAAVSNSSVAAAAERSDRRVQVEQVGLWFGMQDSGVGMCRIYCVVRTGTSAALMNGRYVVDPLQVRSAALPTKPVPESPP